jgi:DNA mismatch endonuclease (patch repair protein)
MADRLSPEHRSWLMSRVGKRDTTPEKQLRSALHKLGLRFRLHDKRLPGTPDIVMPGRNAVIFVHGCFWHRHANCKRASMPSTRRSFWQLKFERNIKRDKAVIAKLRRLGWRVFVVWSCQTKDASFVARRIFHRLVR